MYPGIWHLVFMQMSRMAAVDKTKAVGKNGDTVQAAIGEMVDRIAERFRPHRIILFGSQARGTSDYHSDVDLLVVMEDGTDKQGAAVEMRRAVMDSPVAKDIVVTTPDEIRRRGNVVGTVLRAAFREGGLVQKSMTIGS